MIISGVLNIVQRNFAAADSDGDIVLFSGRIARNDNFLICLDFNVFTVKSDIGSGSKGASSHQSHCGSNDGLHSLALIGRSLFARHDDAACE